MGPASRVAPLDKLSVPLVMVFAWLLLGEKLNTAAIIGGALITAGAIGDGGWVFDQQDMSLCSAGLQSGCRVGLQARTYSLPAWTPAVQPVYHPNDQFQVVGDPGLESGATFLARHTRS